MTRRIHSYLLPVGLVVALVVSLAFPLPGRLLGELTLGPLDWASLSVVVIFVITGYVFEFESLTGRSFALGALICIVTNLVVPPLLVWLLFQWLTLPLGLALGTAVVVSVPTTLSTATVLTALADGDHDWAVGLTVVVLTVGAFTAPLAVSALLSTSVSIPAGPLLLKVILLVTVPLLVGLLLRRLLGRDMPDWVTLVPSLAVIGVVWVTLSQSQERLVSSGWAEILAVLSVAIVGHAVLLLLAWVGAARFARPRAAAVFFVVAQKTLPLSLSVIVAVTTVAPQLAAVAPLAVVLCVVWHFLQLLVDSALVGTVRTRLGVDAASGRATE